MVMRCTLFAFTTLGLLMAATDTRADQVRREHRRTVRHVAGQRQVVKQQAAQPVTRVRQIDGKTLWDLGMQNGSWPKLP